MRVNRDAVRMIEELVDELKRRHGMKHSLEAMRVLAYTDLNTMRTLVPALETVPGIKYCDTPRGDRTIRYWWFEACPELPGEQTDPKGLARFDSAEGVRSTRNLDVEIRGN